MLSNNHTTWTIVEKCEEAPGVTSLVLDANGEQPPFIAGQYLTVLIPGFEPIEGKSYSISSIPKDERVVLTVKEMGNFSRALRARDVGSTLTTSLPYGFFYPEPDEQRDLAFVVGGIGITPCISIIEDLLTKGFDKSMTLFYSNKTVEGIVFKNRLDTLAQNHENLTIHYFITQENLGSSSPRPGLGKRLGRASAELHEGRMTAELIITHLENSTETDFFLCGSINFTKSLWTSLRTQNIPSPNLYTEGFF